LEACAGHAENASPDRSPEKVRRLKAAGVL
jgi:hypothetical protein